MRYVKQQSGTFTEWPFFQPHEIEKSAVADLRTCGLLPETPGEVDVDSLVQSLFGFSPTYTDPGEGVLGYIRFGTRRPETIILHQALGDLNAGATTEHRRRSTLAHEIGHGQLHCGFFTELMQAKKAGISTERVRNPKASATFLCRTGDIRDGEAGAFSGLPTWERMAEWQANRYMAAVLVPAGLARMKIATALGLTADDTHSRIALNPADCDALAPGLAECFNVSRQLATCRLRELFPASAQEDLFAA